MKSYFTSSSSYLISLIAFIVFAVILYGEDFMSLLGPQLELTLDRSLSRTGRRSDKKLPFAIGRTEEGCDIFSGKWVRDEINRPLYEASECPYIQPQQACQESGRPDKEYQYWRWQPHGCSLPSFNATIMLEALRGKKMMFIGDSVARGHYLSMVCLLHKLIPEDSKSLEIFDSLKVFTAKNYNASIEFFWAPFLLESNAENEIGHRNPDRIVRTDSLKDSINKRGQHWKGVDILVFNTYLWWVMDQKMKILKGSFNDEKKEIIQLTTEDAYHIAIESMAKWVKENMDPKKTRVVFTSLSPNHGNFQVSNQLMKFSEVCNLLHILSEVGHRELKFNHRRPSSEKLWVELQTWKFNRPNCSVSTT